MIEFIILVVLVVSLTFALYKISLLSTKETSFEEAISSQKIDIFEDTSKVITKKAKEKVKPPKLKPHKKEESVISPSHSKVVISNSSKAKEAVTNDVTKKPDVKVVPIAKPAKVKEVENISKSVPSESQKLILPNEGAKYKSAERKVHGKNEELEEICSDLEANTESGKINMTVDKENKKPLSMEKKSKSFSSDQSVKLLKQCSNDRKSKEDSEISPVKREVDKSHSVKVKQQSVFSSYKKVHSPEMPSSKPDDLRSKNDSSSKKDMANKKSSTDNSIISQPEEKLKLQDKNQISAKVTEKKTEKQNTIEKSLSTKNKENKKVVNGKDLHAKVKTGSFNLEIVAGPNQKRKKKDVIDLTLDASDDVAAKFLHAIQKSELTGNEIQSLIDALLDKEIAIGQRRKGDEWVEVAKVDPVVTLKKQLEESEAKITEQSEAHQTLSTKIQELRSNLNEQISKNAVLKKRLESSSEVTQQKIDAATRQIESRFMTETNELRTSLENEYQSKLVQSQKIAKEKSESRVQELQHSNSELEFKLSTAQTHLDELRVLFTDTKSLLSESENKIHSMTQSCDANQSKYRDLEAENSSLKQLLNSQKSEFSNHTSLLQQKLSSAETDHSSTLLQISQLTQENNKLYQQMREVNEAFTQNQNMLKNSMQQKSDLEKELLQSNREVKTHKELVEKQKRMIVLLNEEKDSLASQVIRPAAEGQENGDLHHEQKEQLLNNHCDHSENELEILSLKKEVSRLKNESSILSKRMEEEFEKCDNISKNTKSVLVRIFPTLKTKENLEHDKFLLEVESASKVSQSKEVSTKIEVEKVVEKVVQDPVLIKQVNELQVENELLKIKLSAMSAEVSPTPPDSLKLAEELDNYKEVLRNTECLLKNLQKSVVEEEKQFMEKVQIQDEQIQRLNEEKKKLLLQLDVKNYSEKISYDSTEMEAELSNLRTTLKSEEEQKNSWKLKCDQLEKQIEEMKGKNAGLSNGPCTRV